MATSATVSPASSSNSQQQHQMKPILTEFKVSPPGPAAQYINQLLHIEPFSFLFHGLFWGAVLIFAFPVAGWLLLLSVLVKAVRGFPKPERIHATKNNKDESIELAVYVSGCDTGFGKDLTFALAARGFTVFPGCFSEASMIQYEGFDAIIPLKADVTNDEDCLKAASEVSKWLLDCNAKSPRFLHAVVNNAGIGAAGLIDWTPVSTYQRVLDVNYYGAIRTTKAFLSILKMQCYTQSYAKARVINVASISGLFAGNIGSSVYSGSKHAMEAFSACLRMELTNLGISVVTINPSSHSTAMGQESATHLQKTWDNLNTEMREAYGEDYFSSLLEAVANLKKLTWDPKYVQEALVSSIELSDPQPQVIVGMDAKYFVLVVRLFPMWMQVKVLTTLSSKAVPSCMKVET